MFLISRCCINLLVVIKPPKLLNRNIFNYCFNLYSCNYSQYHRHYRLKASNEPLSDALESKHKLISHMDFKNSQDAAPFSKLSLSTLVKIFKVMQHDKKTGCCDNRLYYIADRLKCSPTEINEKLAKRNFVYTLSFDWLKNSLDVLLEMGVLPDRIKRDLWVIKYHHKTIRERLQKLKDLGITSLFPWMVRCDNHIMERFIQLSCETKNILGNSSTEMYLAKRLNISPEQVEEMCQKLPALRKIRVPKLKSFLDFLMCEGFGPQDIADKIRVLMSSEKTIQQRLEVLRKLGVESINLNVLCRRRKDFNKYCEVLESAKK